MNLKNNKGVTMVALIVIVLSIIILSSIAIPSGVNTIRYVKYKKAKAQMKIMQAEVNSWYEEWEYNGFKNDDQILSYGESISSSTKDSTLEKVIRNLNINPDNYRLFTSKCLIEEMGIDGVNSDFLINIKDNKIIYVNGVYYVADGNKKMYYTLEDFGLEELNIKISKVWSVDFDLDNEFYSGIDKVDVNVKNIKVYGKYRTVLNDEKVKVWYKKTNESDWVEIKELKNTAEGPVYTCNIIKEGEEFDITYQFKVTSEDGNIEKVKTVDIKFWPNS